MRLLALGVNGRTFVDWIACLLVPIENPLIHQRSGAASDGPFFNGEIGVRNSEFGFGETDG